MIVGIPFTEVQYGQHLARVVVDVSCPDWHPWILG
jgi:hypothetical protein